MVEDGRNGCAPATGAVGKGLGSLVAGIPFAVLLVGLWISMVAALCIGSVTIPFRAVLGSVLGACHVTLWDEWPEAYGIILFHLRLPRVLLAALVGGSLALTGAVMQGVFRNPMADPGIIEVSSGGALGAIIAIYTGIAFMRPFALPAFAFPGAAIAVFMVYGLATQGCRTPISAVLLSGIAVSSLLTAVSSFILSLSESIFVLREMVFWIMGGRDGRGWSHLALAGIPAVLGSLAMCTFSRDLNVMALEGEEGAMILGVNVRRVTQILLTLSALVTGAVVSVSGGIGFVGLIVPHAVRLVLGPNHRVLLPASFLGGAIFLIWADLASRSLLHAEELRLGIVTAFVGSPFFLFLLQRNLRRDSWN
jgi:iron complex transport system permease protein